MAGYSFRKQAAMTFTNSSDASRLSQETSPDRKQSDHQTFAAVCHRLAQTVTLATVTADRERPRVARTPSLEKRD